LHGTARHYAVDVRGSSNAGAFAAIADVVATSNGVNGIVFSGDRRGSVVRSRADSNALVRSPVGRGLVP
jgi:hypothetical protein